MAGDEPEEPPRPALFAVPDDDELDGADPAADRRSRRRPVTSSRLLPRSVTVALGVVIAEVVLLVLAIALLTSTMLQNAETDPGLTLATMVFVVLMAVALVFGGFALLRGRRWGRAPLLTWQVLQALVTYPALQGNARLPAIVILGLSALGLAALVAPGTTRHIGGRD